MAISSANKARWMFGGWGISAM